MAIAEQEIPEKTKPKPLPRVRLELVDIFGRMAQSLSFPRSVGEIYGLLYLAPAPMSAPEICEALSISKGSVSTGTRQLLTLGFVRKVWLQEERKDYFEAVLELGEMVRTAYDQIFKMRAQNADRRLTDVTRIRWPTKKTTSAPRNTRSSKNASRVSPNCKNAPSNLCRCSNGSSSDRLRKTPARPQAPPAQMARHRRGGFHWFALG